MTGTDERNKGGRPTEWTDEAIQAEADALLEWLKEADKFTPRLWIGEFATERGYARQRMSDWALRHDGFLDIYTRAKSEIETNLVRMGFSEGFDPRRLAYLHFHLARQFKWTETQEINQTTDLTVHDDSNIEALAHRVDSLAARIGADRDMEQPE